MVRRCFVPFCATGKRSSTEKFSIFRVPKDENMFRKWKEVIPTKNRPLTSKDHVCEKHFEKRYIIPRFQQSSNEDFYHDLSRTKLVPYAVPTIFPHVGVKENLNKIDKSSSIELFDDENNSLHLSQAELSGDIVVNEDDAIPICFGCLTGKECSHILLDVV